MSLNVETHRKRSPVRLEHTIAEYLMVLQTIRGKGPRILLHIIIRLLNYYHFNIF